MIAGEEVQPIGQKILRAMREAVGRFLFDDPGLQKMGKVAIKGDFAQAYDDAHAREDFNLSGKVSGAIANLLGRGFVAGRSATDNGGDPGVAKLETVITRGSCRLTGEAQLVEYGIHKVSRAVACEGTSCTIRSMRTGGETEDEDAGARIPKAGDGASPVGLVLIRSSFRLPDSAAVIA